MSAQSQYQEDHTRMGASFDKACGEARVYYFDAAGFAEDSASGKEF